MEDEKSLSLYIELDPKDVSNLTKEANKSKIYED